MGPVPAEVRASTSTLSRSAVSKVVPWARLGEYPSQGHRHSWAPWLASGHFHDRPSFPSPAADVSVTSSESGLMEGLTVAGVLG